MTVEAAVGAGMMTDDDVLEAIADFCRPVPWEDAKISGDQARTMFKDILKFKEVKVFYNLSKDDVIEELLELQRIADEFEEDLENGYSGERSTLAVGIVWIGASLGPYHAEILD